MTLAGLLRRRRRVPAGAAMPIADPVPDAIRSAGRTHVGRVRTVNEDRLLNRPDRALWAVADGMGGHSAGDVAAAMAVTALDRLADGAARPDGAAVLHALEGVNRAIHDHMERSGTTGGATVVAACIADGVATLLWAGDSRAYLIRGGAATLLTHDHSVVQAMVDRGAIAPADADRHPRANLVTRALGVAATVAIDRTRMELRPGDRLMLCSDGVSRSLATHDFARLPDRMEDAADRLIANALQRDGSDNATLVMIAP